MSSTSIAPPPTYFEVLDAPLDLSLPQYTSEASSTEHSVALAITDATALSEYVTKSDHITLNLGPKVWKTRNPCYPRNGVVDGCVDIRNLEHVHKVVVKLIGIIKTILTDRGLVVAQTKRPLVSHEQNVFPNGRDQVVDAKTSRFRFSIPIPTYVQGGSEELPPSFHANHPHYESVVQYFIKVDLYRKGFRVHESVKSEIYYLPASASPTPSTSSLATSSHTQLPPIPVQGASDATAMLCLPAKKRFPATSNIPFSLKFIAPTSPWAAQLLARNLVVELVRYIVILVDGKRSVRESVLGRNDGLRVQAESEGVQIVQGHIKNVKIWQASSWKIVGMAEVYYTIRFYTASDRPSTIVKLPKFVHEEPISLTTSDAAYSDYILSEPAIGLLPSTGFQQSSPGVAAS